LARDVLDRTADRGRGEGMIAFRLGTAAGAREVARPPALKATPVRRLKYRNDLGQTKIIAPSVDFFDTRHEVVVAFRLVPNPVTREQQVARLRRELAATERAMAKAPTSTPTPVSGRSVTARTTRAAAIAVPTRRGG
jgi:hypothetical protein